MSRSWTVAVAACFGLATTVVLPAGAANATFPGPNGRIAFSTDFAQDEGGRSQVFTVGPNGGGVRQLTHVGGASEAKQPDWSPDGRRILYVTNSTGRFQIWVMRPDGSGQRQLATTPGDDFTPRWSPDGRQVVFSHCNTKFGFPAYCNIEVMAADGTGIRKLVGGNWVNLDPEYSPDGSKIVFDSTRDGLQSAVWVMNADGSGLRRLTEAGLEAFAPDWSPSGARIVFTSDCCLPYSQVYDMRSDGSGVRQLTHVPGKHQAGFATYSPDGRKISFISNLARSAAGPGNDLFTMNADGSNITRLVSSQPGVATSDWGTHR